MENKITRLKNKNLHEKEEDLDENNKVVVKKNDEAC